MKIFHKILTFLMFGFLVLTGSAVSGEFKTNPVAVVELFTSQGCASCPPADAFLVEIQQRPDVLALAYHVDYWDYIGWEDTFGSPAHSDLQRAYAESWGKNRIFTPQMVINGAADFVGSDRSGIEAEIARAQLPVFVDLTYQDGLLEARIDPGESGQSAVVYLVTFKNMVDVDIERGENRGKSISYVQVVTSRRAIGILDPVKGAHIQLPMSELLGEQSDGVMVLVQDQINGLPGPILG
ncbi:MAG: DUF1223 domain-containing protein, partial [Devosiaceae bacterium]|nr:DUF1223 domain-containing protein [Devosiaceae bacterium]